MFGKRKENQEKQTGAKKKHSKKKIFGIIIAAVIVVAVIINAAVGANTAAAMPVQVVQAMTGEITQKVETSGTVASEESKTYFATASAAVETLSAVQGQPVKKGQLLLSYDTMSIENSIKQAEYEKKISEMGADATIAAINNAQKKASEAAGNYDEAVKYVQHYTDCVNQAKAQLAEAAGLSEQQAKLQAEIQEVSTRLEAKPNSEKLKESLEKKQKELKQVEKKLADYNVSEIQNALELCSADLAEYKALKERYEVEKETDPSAQLQKSQQVISKEAAEFSQELVEETLDKAKEGIVSEFDGIVSDVSVVEGQTTMEGAALFTIQNAGKLKVSLSASKYDLEKIALDQKAKLTINGAEYEGTVSNISKIAQTSETGGIVIAVDIHIDNPDAAIILGVEAKVSIDTAKVKDAVLVPMNCVNYASDGVFCYTVVDDKVKKQMVETGISDDTYIQILSGLSEGDSVITNVTGELEEGMSVAIMEDAAADENSDAQTAE